MITVIEGGYIVEKTKVKDIYKLIVLIIISLLRELTAFI